MMQLHHIAGEISMATIDWALDWKFKKCIEGIEGDAINVDLPYDAMFYEKRTYATPNGDKTGYYPGGAYVYEKDFELAKENENCHIALEFDGVYGRCSVYVNGILVGCHEYGYTPFMVDLSGNCHEGNNTVRVEVDNTLVPNSRWYSGSGIYREVKLIKAEGMPISDVRITTKSIRPAVVEVLCNYENAKVEIFDRNNHLVAYVFLSANTRTEY